MPDRAPTAQDVYALVAEFDRPEAMIEAVRKAREKGYTRVRSFSPFPVEGAAEAAGFKEPAIAPVILAGGILGAGGGLWMQIGLSLDYPLNVGGRPVVALPAFALITFELMVLGAVVAGILAMLLLNRLPKLHHPMFSIESFHLASADKFFVAILAEDAKFDRAAVRRFLNGLKPVRVEVATFAEGAP